MSNRVRLHSRLLPLYVAAFFQGFVLWYVVEKLFMKSLGFDDAMIGVMGASYAAAMLAIETPSGVLADRWSRKGVLMLGSGALALSALAGGLSQGVEQYIICAMLWGTFYAFYSGTYDSIVYDTMLEEIGDAEEYERYYGRVKLFDSLGLVLGSLIGAVISASFGLRDPYFWSIIPALLSLLALMRFREPQLHKAGEHQPLTRHIMTTFKAVARRGALLPIIIVQVLQAAVAEAMFEFNQLWYIALALPAIGFGPANSALLATVGLAGVAVSRLRLHRARRMIVAAGVILLASLVLILARNAWLIVAAQVTLTTGLMAVGIVFTKLLHDELPSPVRAGASSAVSTSVRLVFIPLALAFGLVSNESDVFTAAWLFVAILIVAMSLAVRVMMGRHRLLAVNASDLMELETYRK